MMDMLRMVTYIITHIYRTRQDGNHTLETNANKIISISRALLLMQYDITKNNDNGSDKIRMQEVVNTRIFFLRSFLFFFVISDTMNFVFLKFSHE